MSPKTPESLRLQAETLAAAAEGAALWFRRPQPEALAAARAARERARAWRQAAVTALKGVSGPAKTDAADFSFALREAVEHAARAAVDAAKWDMGVDKGFAAMAGALRDGAVLLAQAADAEGEERADLLIEAKQLAAEVERRRRALRAAAHDSPHFVASVKRAEIATLLSAAAENLQAACDALAGSLGE